MTDGEINNKFGTNFVSTNFVGISHILDKKNFVQENYVYMSVCGQKILKTGKYKLRAGFTVGIVNLWDDM